MECAYYFLAGRFKPSGCVSRLDFQLITLPESALAPDEP